MSYCIDDLITLLDGEVKGSRVEKVSTLTPFFHSKEDSITFASEEKFLKNISETKARVVIVPEMDLPQDDNKMYIIVKENPRYLMPKILKFFKRKLKAFEKMREATSKIGKNCSIGFNVYIGHDVIIGDGVTIYPNVYIGEGSVIGDGCLIYPNVTIREFVKIGKNSIIQAGAVIGTDGFGFVKHAGNNVKIEQIGGVMIEEEVEIGANCVIDRGAIGDTIIKKYTKLSNLVQIAHNDVIGENCLIVAQVGIAGSTEIGDNVTLAGKVGVTGHIKIGKNTTITGGSNVIGNVGENKIMSGDPLVEHNESLKMKVAMKRLPELLKKIKNIEKILKINN